MSTPFPIPSPPPPDQPVGEYIPRELAEVQQELARVRALARILDSAFEIPGTRFKVGLDPVIGLFPVVGDLISMAIGGYILTTAARLGVPKAVLTRMLLNLGTDVAAGSVPLVGDVLDAAWRANSKNARLLEQALADPKRAGRSSRWVVFGMLAAVVLITAAGIALAVVLTRLLWNALS
jgi:hypothetical protein